MATDPAVTARKEFDYIIVGSGAGGAPLAAQLAQAGKRVLVIEAGSNHTSRGPLDPANEISRVPLLHAASTEHEALAWRFFVDHYERQNGKLPEGIPEDPKWHQPDPARGEDATHAGIFYPRAAALGGCTVHNAMITIAGPDSDWDDLADYLQDDSWRADHMRSYFQKLEHNDYLSPPELRKKRPVARVLQYVWRAILWLFGWTPDLTAGKHGFGGWLHTSVTDLRIGLEDKQLVKMLKAALWQSRVAGLDRAWSLVRTFLKGRIKQSLDPNHSDTQAKSPEGVVQIPLAVHGRGTTIHQNRAMPYAMLGRRSSPRELLLETLASYPENLEIWTDCLVTKVILEDAPKGDRPKAVGVELLRGARLYKAHVNPSEDAGSVDHAWVTPRGEVILSGGTFNTPQLLMLSGIGDRNELSQVPNAKPASSEEKIGIECRVNLPGVGKNLQDRYEVSIVSEMKREFSLLDGATFELPADPNRPDPHLRVWRNEGTGLYSSNGAVLGIFKRSRPDLPKPDLFLFGIPSSFRGYEVGYSKPQPHNLFTWVILKSHSHNRDGTVRLRNNDPRQTPRINFNSFQTHSRPGQSDTDPDVIALMDGVKFVRGILNKARWIVKGEIHPASARDPVETDRAINEWIRRDAWGHHASGTCRMGPDGDPGAVLDSRFRVRGVSGLRVVDASIFPRIPGYFVVTNIYMASEKAADVILEDSRRTAGEISETYPTELRKLEISAITTRRNMLEAAPATAQTGVVADEVPDGVNAGENVPPDSVWQDGCWRDNVCGLALSGGGIRSATFCLGVLQALARHRRLRDFDFLSTVSGGGYIGSFLGRFFDRHRASPAPGNIPQNGVAVPDRVENELVSPDSKVVDWLRKHGNYIAPQGQADGRTNFAIFVRNLLSVHIVVGLAIFTILGITNALRYGLFDQFRAVMGLTVSEGSLPLSQLMESWLGPFFSPWFVVVDLLALTLVLPRIVAYWIVSQDRHEAFTLVPTSILFFLSGGLLFLGVSDGLRLEPLSIGLALLISLIYVESAWKRGRRKEMAVGTGTVESQRQRTRNYITEDLGLALAMTGIAVAFAIIDTLGHGLQEWSLQQNQTYAKAFATLSALIGAAFPVVRFIASQLMDQPSGQPSTIRRILSRDLVLGTMAVVLFTVPLLLYSLIAHVAYSGDAGLRTGLTLTAITASLSLLIAHPSAVVFVNRSSLAQTYSARLARAYLGASNPLRHRPEGINVTEVIPGDDIASIVAYRPHEAAGPFHLINLTIDQTIEKESMLRRRDRQGDILAVSCLGVSVGEKFHSAWEGGPDCPGRVGPPPA